MWTRTGFVIAFSSVLVWSGSLRAAEPEEVLKGRGLTRVGAVYLVEEDVKLADGLKAVRAARKQQDDYKSRKAVLDRQLKAAYANVKDWSAQYDRISAQMKATSSGASRQYNELVGQHNALEHRMFEARRLILDKEKEAALQDPVNRYLSAVVALADQMEAGAKKYEALGADAEVKAALAKLNEKPGPKVKLGPSQVWPEELKKVRYQRQQIVAAPIAITLEGGTPHVPVTLNGKVTQTMVVDSGASAVSISAKVAEQCGLVPGPGDPTINAETADGRKVEVKVMVLESVQVGPFTVRHVECYVQPKSAGEPDGLLGASFLRHFSYKSDLAAGELHLTQLTEPTKKEGEKPAAVVAGDEKSGKKGDGFDIASVAGWIPIGFNVEAGKCYLVKAKGKWTGSNGVASGPQGACPPEQFYVLGPQPYQTEEQKAYYLGQFPRNALIGRIGSETWSFYVGPECRFVAPVSGVLSFKINDTTSASPTRKGSLDVTVEAVQPDWTNRRGQTEILARVDDKDRLHLSDKGMYWEYGGSWGKVGLHDGYWPTVVNGIYWWPKWADEKHTEPLAAPELWPKALNKFQLVQVVAKRGKVEVAEKGPPEVVLSFGDQGLGSSQVGCLIATGNVPRAGEAAGKR